MPNLLKVTLDDIIAAYPEITEKDYPENAEIALYRLGHTLRHIQGKPYKCLTDDGKSHRWYAAERLGIALFVTQTGSKRKRSSYEYWLGHTPLPMDPDEYEAKMRDYAVAAQTQSIVNNSANKLVDKYK